MVPNRSLIDLTVFDDAGRVGWQVSYVFTGALGGVATFEFLSMKEQGYAANGQLGNGARTNGYREVRLYSNGRPAGHVSNDGVYTAYQTDVIGRRVFENRDGFAASGDYPAHLAVHTNRSFDAAGRVLSETVYPANSPSAPEAVTSTQTFNLAGQLLTSTAESSGGNFTTTSNYANGGRTVLHPPQSRARTSDFARSRSSPTGSGRVPCFWLF
jgi:hypothetical protein